MISRWSRISSCGSRSATWQHPVNLPCFGIFEIADGKIAEWRDYFDMATFTNAMG